jgi:NAD(P)-dependent dehydrogenase (short-subunit alcohol dehydrogenase family)
MTAWTAADLPSFAGRSVIVTGANVGAQLILAVRNTGKGEAAAQQMTGDVEVRRLDLADLASVRQFAEGIDKVDVLINNAGIMATPHAVTADGFESQIGTNHLGHFALTNLLVPKLTDRVVTVSSIMHWMGHISLNDLNWTARPYSAWLAYGQSKLANLLFTRELQRRLTAVGSPLRAVACHPGYSHTNLQGRSGRKFADALMSFGTRLLATDPEFGARQTLYAASQDVPGDSFIGPRFVMVGRTKPVGRSPLAKREGTAQALWELSERLTDTKFPL